LSSPPAAARGGSALLDSVRERVDRFRQRMLQAEAPLAAVEVRPHAIGVVRAVREVRGRSLGAAASLELPRGTLNVSMSQPNVVDAAAFRNTLRAVLERAGVLGGARVALVLPDPVARVTLVPALEARGRTRAETEDLLRFRLRKSVPFDIREARMAFAPAGPEPQDPIVVAVTRRAVVEDYEQVCASLGLHAGLVEIAGLALFRASLAGQAGGDRLLVNWDQGYVSFILSRNERPLLFRTLVGGAAEPREVARELASTELYYRERLGGDGLEQTLLRCAAVDPDEAVELLRQPMSGSPELLDAWGGLGADYAAMAQALAGAAASILGRTA
jgi:type IV pilus assembly protein PilM